MIIVFKSNPGLFSVHTKSMPERAGARENRTTGKDKEKEHKNVRARDIVASRVGIVVVVDVPRASHARDTHTHTSALQELIIVVSTRCIHTNIRRTWCRCISMDAGNMHDERLAERVRRELERSGQMEELKAKARSVVALSMLEQEGIQNNDAGEETLRDADGIDARLRERAYDLVQEFLEEQGFCYSGKVFEIERRKRAVGKHASVTISKLVRLLQYESLGSPPGIHHQQQEEFQRSPATRAENVPISVEAGLSSPARETILGMKASPTNPPAAMSPRSAGKSPASSPPCVKASSPMSSPWKKKSVATKLEPLSSLPPLGGTHTANQLPPIGAGTSLSLQSVSDAREADSLVEAPETAPRVGPSSAGDHGESSGGAAPGAHHGLDSLAADVDGEYAGREVRPMSQAQVHSPSVVSSLNTAGGPQGEGASTGRAEDENDCDGLEESIDVEEISEEIELDYGESFYSETNDDDNLYLASLAGDGQSGIVAGLDDNMVSGISLSDRSGELEGMSGAEDADLIESVEVTSGMDFR